ncbi:MAG: hypothetical protein K2I72_01530 [Bacilli bacterium]|nr:hypothetical protein [Bacilli bacterium]
MSLNWDMLQELLIIAIACSTITVAFIQKTKRFCKNKKCVNGYSFVVNMVFGYFFSKTFTGLSSIQSLWVGLFSFIGADTIYRNLEGKLTTYTELREGSKKQSNASNSFVGKSEKQENTTSDDEIIGVISRD